MFGYRFDHLRIGTSHKPVIPMGLLCWGKMMSRVRIDWRSVMQLAAAARRAKLHFLKQPLLGHPDYWGAFISAGDWTPLDKGSLRPASPSRPQAERRP